MMRPARPTFTGCCVLAVAGLAGLSAAAAPPMLPGGPSPASAALGALPWSAAGALPARPAALPPSGPALLRVDAPAAAMPEFLSSYLGPRVAARLDGLRPRIEATHAGASPFDFAAVEALSTEARSGSLRGAEAAVRGWLLERTALDRLTFEVGRTGARSSTTGTTGARLGFGFTGAVPRMDVVCPTGSGDVRVRLAAQGEVSLEMQAGTARRVYLGASADPRHDSYGMTLAGSF